MTLHLSKSMPLTLFPLGVCLWFMGCSEETEPPRPDAKVEPVICVQKQMPCSFGAQSQEGLERRDALIQEIQSRFNYDVVQIYQWLQTQDDVLDLESDQTTFVSFRVEGTRPWTIVNMKVEHEDVPEASPTDAPPSSEGLTPPVWRTHTQALSLPQGFVNVPQGVATKQDRFSRRALFSLPWDTGWGKRFSFSQDPWLKQSAALIEGLPSFNEVKIETSDNIFDGNSLKSGTEEENIIAQEKLFTQLTKHYAHWREYEFVYITSHSMIFDNDISYEVNTSRGKIKLTGVLIFAAIPMKAGTCKHIEKSDLFKNIDGLSCSVFQIRTTNPDDPSKEDLTYIDTLLVDTDFLITQNSLPFEEQNVFIDGCNLGGFPDAIPTYDSNVVAFKQSSYPIFSSYRYYLIIKKAIELGVSPSILSYLDENPKVKGSIDLFSFLFKEFFVDIEVLYNISSPGQRLEEVVKIINSYEPAPLQIDLSDQPNQKIKFLIEAHGPLKQDREPDTSPDAESVDWLCDLNEATYYINLTDSAGKVLASGEAKVDPEDYQYKQSSPFKYQIPLSFPFKQELKKNTEATLMVQMVFDSNPTCHKGDTWAKAQALLLPDLGCPTWTSSAGGSTFVGNHASVLGGTDFYTLNFEVLSRVTQDEEVGTGITGNAFLFLDGRAEIVFTDQKFLWSTETPLTWIGEFDNKQRLIGSINGQITQTPYGGTEQMIVPFNLQFKTMPINQAAAVAHCVNN